MDATATSDNRRDRAFDRYLADITRHPLLTRERERALAEKYRKDGDLEAAQELVVSNLRFVVKVCRRYRGYGVGMLDLVQEGNIGLIQAVRKFDPARGFRLISYAVWWIRAALNNLVLRSWSLVKVGTTQTERRLFFKLRSARGLADRDASGDVRASTDLLVERFDVAEPDIAAMEGRLARRDLSLDAPGHTSAPLTWVQAPGGDAPSQEDRLDELATVRMVRASISATMPHLGERERYVVKNRLMAVEPETLQDIADRFGISRERVRQIEGRIRGKIRRVLVDERSPARGLTPGA